MTDASKRTIDAALAAYEKMDSDERDVFEYVLSMRNPEPAPKRGRPVGSGKKANDGAIDKADGRA